MTLTRITSALALMATTTLALAACTSATNGSGEQNGTLNVVTTTTQLHDFAEQVGGSDIELTSLLQPGSSAHGYEPSPADLIALGNADVLIMNGAGLDEFIESEIEASGFAGTIIDASTGVDLKLAREITAEGLGGEAHDHADEATDTHADEATDTHADEAHADEATDTHGDEAHAHEAHAHDESLNPHLWTAPRFAQAMVSEIAAGLAEADPAHATEFEQRAADYNAQLGELDLWVAAQFERVPDADRVLVTGHDSLRYYLHDYNIAFAGSLLPNFEDNSQPSATEIEALIESINANGVKAIFVESTLSPKLAETVARETGAQVLEEASLYVDSLGAEGTGAEDYIAATVHNTRVILEAWGITPDPLPKDLETV